MDFGTKIQNKFLANKIPRDSKKKIIIIIYDNLDRLQKWPHIPFIHLYKHLCDVTLALLYQNG